MLILDTNAIIGYLAGNPQLTKPIDAHGQHGEAIGVPTIVVTELLSYSALSEDHILRIDDFLQAAQTLPLSESVARMAAKMRRRYHLTTIDAVIAATAIMTENGHLVTPDKAFQKVKVVSLLEIL